MSRTIRKTTIVKALASCIGADAWTADCGPECSSSLCSTVRASSLGVKPFGLIRHGPKDISNRIGDPDGQNDDRANWHRLQSGSPRICSGCDWDDAIADLMHLCDRETHEDGETALDFSAELRASSKQEQATPKLSASTQQLDSGRRKQPNGLLIVAALVQFVFTRSTSRWMTQGFS